MNDTTENNTDINAEKRETVNLKIDQSILVDEQPKLSTVLSAFRNLDKVCYRLGLLNKNSSLATNINWTASNDKNDLPEILKQLDKARDQVEQQIVQLKKMMTNRCLTILAWEFIVLFTIIIGLLAGSYYAGYWVNGIFSPPWLNEFLSRPILTTISSLLFITGFVILHYSLRSFFAQKIAHAASKKDSKFTLANAFLINSKFIHSIFRPEPIGLHWVNRKRLQNAHDLFLSQSPNKEKN
ncbi:MAG: hypothetical protein ACC653_10945 [Gammaproteobacteria bacterium]